MKLTEYLKLKKPGVDDAMDIEVLNENFDAIDGHIQNNKAKLGSIAYGVCNTAKGTAAKVISCSGFNLCDGARILISFANGNTSNYMTLNVNNTGTYFVWFPIGSSRAYNNELISKFIVGGCAYEFVYQDGSTPKWMYCGAASIPINDETPTYTEAANRENLSSGEKLSAAFGKIKKWFSDLKSVAFSNDYNDLDNTPTALKNPNSLTLTMNGSSSSYNGASAASKSWYAPTTAGTAGYELVSNGSGAPVWKAPSYAVCSTAGATAAKTTSIANFKLLIGARVLIKFTYAHANLTQPATLNISGTGAKPIKYFGREVYGYHGSHPSGTFYYVSNTWEDGETVEFIYNGTEWVGTANKISDPLRTLVGKQHKVWSSSSGTSVYSKSQNNRFCDFMCFYNGNDSEVLQEAINSTVNNGAVILTGFGYVLTKPVILDSHSSGTTIYRITIEGAGDYDADNRRTEIKFKDDGRFISDNYGSGAVCVSLTLRNLRINSETVKSIIDLKGHEESEIVLENTEISFEGDNFGEFYPLIADKVIMKIANIP